MQTVLIIALSLHVLAAVFWAGGTFVMARGAGDGPRLAKPMAGAALVTLLSGGYLWRALHGAAFGKPETVLAVGIACALLAFALQAGGGAVTRGQIKRGVLTADSARARMIAIQRIAAPLLAIAIVTMVSARFA
ncbi:MAG TPA: hypothetical protein VJ806_16155 [Luteimonas sp.]|nr:hypothetical protein [Luteimonas sp.]